MFDFLKSSKKSKVTYSSASEFVSPGHPDRLADILAAIVINDIQKNDGFASHAAIEVFITHDTITFGGEATTSLPINFIYLKKVVSKGFKMAGYIPQMRNFWTKDQVALASNFTIYNKIEAQSPDIALGTTDKGNDSGFNDQGVFFSSSENTNSSKLGTPHALAQMLSEGLWYVSRDTIENPDKYDGIVLGPDNKAVVSVKVAADGITPIEIESVTLAVSHSQDTNTEKLELFVKDWALRTLATTNIPYENTKFIINGTGRFVVHGPVSDTSMTGRKISVSHPSAGPVWCNKMIGGGSLTKPMHASDLILNLASRLIANAIVESGLSKYAVVGISCAIGQVNPQSIFIKGDDKFEKDKRHNKVVDYFINKFNWRPYILCENLGFFDSTFDFSQAIQFNLFGHPEHHPWDNPTTVKSLADSLLKNI